MEIEVIWATIATILVIILVIVLVKMHQRHVDEKNQLTTKHKDVQKKTMTLGKNIIRGELNEILGTFKLLNEYENIAIVTGATSPSLDLIGINNDSVDFIEIKSLGTHLSKPEKKIKSLIDEKKVRYVIMEGNIPKFFELKKRE